MRHALILFLGVAACADQPDTVAVNRGHACALAWPPTWDMNTELSNEALRFSVPYDEGYDYGYDVRAFAANKPALIAVHTTASPCATDLRATCGIEQRGNDLVIRSLASWNEPDQPCLIRQGPPSVTALCKSSGLEIGSYTVRFLSGDVRGAFAIPGDESLNPCFEMQ